MEKVILVLGGTGLLGNPTAHHLNKVGFKVRVLSRNIQKAKKLFDDSFELIEGDAFDTRCLEEAMKDCYGVHISLPTDVEQQAAESVSQLAPSCGIKRITYISGATVAEEHRWFPMVDRKFIAEQAIRESNIPFTIIYPTWVMEGLSLFVVQGRASTFGKQPYPYHWVSADDLARMVSMSYLKDEAANKRFRAFGPEQITIQAALTRYCAVVHPEIKSVTNMPFWLVKLMAFVMRNQGLKGAGEMMAYFERVGEDNSTVFDDGSIIGAPAIRFEQWLEKQATKEA